jgi:CheY-like chemotaxis protein
MRMKEGSTMKEQLTILLVDDDQDFIEQMQYMLETAGHRVHPASGREAALEIIERLKPDLAVIDLMMNRNDDGFVLAYQIKKKYPEVPVIMVTGVTSETGIDFGSSMDTGGWMRADALLQKPVRFEQLDATMKRLLND